MNKTLGLTLAVFTLAATLGGCESARKSFGGAKSPPDEFVVYKRPPLSLPPDYGLRPPKPGAAQPQEVQPTTIARQAIRQATTTAPKTGATKTASTPGLQALLRETGGTAADPDIRSRIDEETSIYAKEDSRFVDKLIFWVDDIPDEGTTVDAKKEQKRIMENQALGKKLNDGATPEVKRKQRRKGLLNF